MEIGRTPIIAPSTVANTTNGNNVQAVQTILPQDQAVPQAGRSESIPLTFREVPLKDNNDTKEPLPAEQGTAEQQNSETQRGVEVRKEIEVDRETSALVFRAIDVTTGDVVRQYPGESRLKLSAYIDRLLT